MPFVFFMLFLLILIIFGIYLYKSSLVNKLADKLLNKDPDDKMLMNDVDKVLKELRNRIENSSKEIELINKNKKSIEDFLEKRRK